MRHLIFALALCCAVSASAVTATKEYVDRKDFALASSATNLVASATTEISKAVTKAQATADGAATAAASAQATADAAKASAAKNAEAIADETSARESADSALTNVVTGKANASEVYKKTETYTQSEINAKIAAATPSDYESVKSQVATNKTAIADETTAREKADTANADALAAHTGNTANPHKVTAAQVGALTAESDPTFTKWQNGVSVALGFSATTHASQSVALGCFADTRGNDSVAVGAGACATVADSVAFAPPPSLFYLNSFVGNSGSTARTLQSYLDERATTNALAEVEKKIPVISATDATFSNAVLAVGLNIDTDSVAVLNEIAKDFGGFPLSAGETATTVGGLLAALAAGLAALKKSVSTLSAKVDDANAALEEVA